MARDIVDDRLLGALHLRALTRAGLAHDRAAEHTTFQAGTLDALLAGRYDGDATLADLLAHGDLGLGTTQGLGGELVVLDGEAFVVDGDGVVRPVPPTTRTPFAVVCRFQPVASVGVEQPLRLDELEQAIDGLAPTGAEVVAVRVDGELTDLRLRSVRAPSRPYPPLAEVTAHQTEWSVPAMVGTLVGFRFPDATAGVEVPGWHLHALADDRTAGGHVLDVTVAGGRVRVDGGDELHVEVPAGLGLGVPGATDRAAIRSVEGG